MLRAMVGWLVAALAAGCASPVGIEAAAENSSTTTAVTSSADASPGANTSAIGSSGGVTGGVNCQVRFTFTGVAAGQGALMAAIYADQASFAGRERPTRAETCLSDDVRVVWQVELPPGDYAVAVFQDTNQNGRLDRGILSIPTEPYGFSGNPSSLRGPPAYEDVVVAVECNGEYEIQLGVLPMLPASGPSSPRATR